MDIQSRCDNCGKEHWTNQDDSLDQDMKEDLMRIDNWWIDNFFDGIYLCPECKNLE